MHKIKKGIKKKIKGKKDKEDELFTEEEYERYKKQKEEESKLHECPTEPEQVETAAPVVEYTTNSSNSSPPEAEENGTEQKEDWRNFLSTTDTVLKKSSENLEQIKDTSYFQVKKVEKEEVEEVQSPSATPVPVAAPHKNWVDLHKGLDDEEETEESPKPESPKKPIELRVRELKEIAPIEALPSVDVEDYADIFDTTYVDQVESGEVQLYIIPDSPSEDEFNDLDLFDTSIVDKVLAPKEPKKKKTKKGTKKEVKKVFKKEPVKEEPPKKKPVLVNLGSAVQALTKGEPVPQEEKLDKSKSEKKQSPKQEEVNLLFSDAEVVPPSAGSEEVVVEPGVLDSILFSDEPVGDLPEVVCPIQAVTADKTENDNESESTKPVIDVNEFLELTETAPSEKTEGSNLQILVAEFEPGTKPEVEVLQPTEYKAVDDDIKDEVDAEFAVLAAESIAKEKDKSICEFGIVEGDDPFDTSSIAQVLGEPVTEEAEAPKPEKSKLPADLLASENIESDPFDTSAVKDVLPLDPFETSEVATDLPEGLKPEAPKEDPLDGVDPFDTSVAAEFGKTELRVLEGELLNTLEASQTDEDFDFNPRADEPETKKEISEKSCLLSSELECLDAPVLAPQNNEPVEEVDPFDTSFAEKVQIQSLEAELLSTDSSSVSSNLPSEPQYKKKSPPRPPSPSCRSTVPPIVPATEVDPFDTSIAECLTKSEPVLILEEVKPKHLGLDLKPPRPPSPACLLTTTPLDENPTLLPTSKTPEVLAPEEIDEFDPFDTSIAEQFGKTELRVLETELLVQQTKTVVVSPCEDFDPRAEEEIIENSLPRVPSPDTLLASLGTEEQTLPPLSPDRRLEVVLNSDIDPFDTSVADKLGQSELSFFEEDTSAIIRVQPVHELKASVKPTRPNPPQCIFESTPTDENPTLLPASDHTKAEPEFDADIDPFDTSIAEKFGNTELKAIEESVLNHPNKPSQLTNHIVETEPERTKSVDDILSYSPTAGTLPVLQPITKDIEAPSEEEIDPFDTSIAASFGETELKVLERELLTKSPQCDDNFDPRQGEN